MSYRFGERGGIYKMKKGKRVYIRKNRFGLGGINLKNNSPKKREAYNDLITVLQKIEKKSGENITLYPDKIEKTIGQAAKILQFWETTIQQRRGFLPVDVNSEIIAMLIPFLILNTNGNIITMSDSNLSELENIVILLNRHYKRIFITYVKKTKKF